MKTSTINQENKSLELFRDFIIENNHPCIMAQSVFKMNEVMLREYDIMGSVSSAKKIIKDLKKYLQEYDFGTNSFKTFVATFPKEKFLDEKTFEVKLWEQLNAIYSADPLPWDATVDSDPKSKNFSFSILGKAFYIVGLHPKSSRLARRAPYPAIVFNLHLQFEKLRGMGIYTKVRDRIRQRDIHLQGHINPMMADFGNSSEASQYSGQKVGLDWECPFHSGRK